MRRKRGGRKPSTQRALIIIPVWIVSTVWLWVWCFSIIKTDNNILFYFLAVALLYENFLIPLIVAYYIFRIKLPSSRRPEKNKKVAMITLCVPSYESIEIIEQQMHAMKAVTYPHDSWILDEENNPIVKKLARKYKVKYFTRRGNRKYNRGNFPFKAKCKAGNVNAWLDRTKRYYKYEYFVQLDIDHHPHPDYLNKTLGHFRDSSIGWVQSPSVYSNLSYWTARGAAEQDMYLQGPVQMGLYGASKTPLIIGSHCVFRTTAICDIGGFQPTRAEDHLNTLALASREWKGVFIPFEIAAGSGPETLSAYLTQQYAWARSIYMVIFDHSQQYIARVGLAGFFQFIFMQSWYPLSTLSFFILYSIPLVTIILNNTLINVSPDIFVGIAGPFLISYIALIWALAPLAQPRNLTISWRGILLHFIRWPIIFSAFLSVIFKLRKPYLVTPKGSLRNKAPSINVYRPFLILTCISLATLVAGYIVNRQLNVNNTIFVLYGITAMLGVCIIDINSGLHRINQSFLTLPKKWALPTASICAVFVMAAVVLTSIAILPKNNSVVSAFTIEDQKGRDINSIPIEQLTYSEMKTLLAVSKPVGHSEDAIQYPGLHDPTQYHTYSSPYIRHSFIELSENWKLAQELLKTSRARAVPLITIEPKGDTDGERLLNDIARGKYDMQLTQINSLIALSKDTVYVRFAQEMDLPEPFVWSNQSPEKFIAAYKHVIDMSRKQGVKNVKWVWSPAGTENAVNYYPGDEYVDIVGTTIIFDEIWSGDYYPSFYELQYSREWLHQYNKPVWITEFCLSSRQPDFQAQLLAESLQNYKSYGYEMLIYMNISDIHMIGSDYHLPDISLLGYPYNK